MRLRYAGRCACGAPLAQGERAAYDRARRVVLCLPCLSREATPPAGETSVPASTSESKDPELAAPPSLDVGVAGAGARREYERRKAKDDAARAERSRVWRALNAFFYPDGRQSTHAWRVGAAGEERVAQALTALVDAGDGYALHDRRVPGKRSNIDHLFVGASAVFVIDAKKYQDAEVSVERSGGLFSPVTETLKVGGRRRTNLVDAVRGQCDVVRTALAAGGHDDVSVVPVLCFVDAYLPFWKKGRHVGDVLLCGPKTLGDVSTAAGELDDERRFAIAMALSTALPSMT